MDEDAANPLLVEHVVALAGAGACGWAVETSRELCDQAAGEWFCAEPGARVENSFVESVVFWAILRLSGVKALPQALATAIGETIGGSVEAGFPSDVLLRCVRLVHAELLQAFFRSCDSALPVAERSAAMQKVSAELFDGMELLASFVADEFSARHARWHLGPVRKRAALVNAILDGSSTDLKKATRQLGYDLTLHHVALVLRCDELTENRAAELKRTAIDFLDASGCSSTLLLPVGPNRLWAWGGRATTKPVEFRRLDTIPPLAPHMHVASGLPGDGVAGFCRSHVQAATAERLDGTVEPPVAGWHDYGALELVLLLGEEIGAAADFVVRELGPLAAADKSTAVLRETVLCYLDQERSVAAVANLLYIAKNTVVYRVKKVEQLLGRSLRELGEDRLRFHTALYLAAKFGSAVLSDHRPEPHLVRVPGQRSA